MNNNDDIKKIIDDFFAGATKEEIAEFMSLLEQKEKGRALLGKLDLRGIASGFTENLKERMGITSERISWMTRDIVRNMLIQYDPNISDEAIDILLNKWVPGRESGWERIPAEAREAMISQFVAYGMGELTEGQLKAFPEKWAEKYWSVFPEELQKLLRACIKGSINKNEFWAAVKKLLHSS